MSATAGTCSSRSSTDARWKGELAVATSPDRATWQYGQVVLSEAFHFSYPFVFEWQGAYYMIPETHETRSIRLYKADDFPWSWSLVHTLMSGERFADATLVRHDDRWWLFTETQPGDEARHAAPVLRRGSVRAWTEHPVSPIVARDARSARPGGSVARDGDPASFATRKTACRRDGF